MSILKIFLLFFSWFLFACGTFILLASFFGTLFRKDFFVKIHAVKLGNIYGITFLMLANALSEFKVDNFFQLLIIIVINILVTIVAVHSLCRLALNQHVPTSALSRKKYEELLLQKNEDKKQ
jgi:monovalent cation/proton antiporter MnhG/PhaG subunit